MGERADELHLAVCRRFAVAVRAADGKWDGQSTCPAWRARDVLEHVIGFHDVLLLRPLGLKPRRPRDEPQLRWNLTYTQLQLAFENSATSRLGAHTLLPRLTQDVLVHTWDLARAVGADDVLDARWCAYFLDQLPDDPNALSRTGMFAPPIIVEDQSGAQAKLLARLGRDPGWRPEKGSQR